MAATAAATEAAAMRSRSERVLWSVIGTLWGALAMFVFIALTVDHYVFDFVHRFPWQRWVTDPLVFLAGGYGLVLIYHWWRGRMARLEQRR